MYDSIYVTFWEKANFGTEIKLVVSRGKGKGADLKGAQYKKGLLGVLEMFYTEGVEVTKQLNTFVKSHQIVHLKNELY